MPPRSRTYKKEEEELLKSWTEKAIVLRVLHAKSHSRFERINTWITIPVIILTSLAGTANVAQSRIPEDFMFMATLIIGCVNLIAAILTTVNNFLKVPEKMEGHRQAAVAFGKYSRHWAAELARSSEDRVSAIEAIRSAKSEYDRLMENGPAIPDDIALDFKNSTTLPGGFAKPEIIGEYEEVCVFGSLSHDNQGERLEESANGILLETVSSNVSLASELASPRPERPGSPSSVV